MIRDDELLAAKDLGSPLLKFSKLEHIVNERFEDAQRNAGHNEAAEYSLSDYVGAVAALGDACGVELPPTPVDGFMADNAAYTFRGTARRISQRARFASVLNPDGDPDTVALDLATKELMRFHSRQIKTVIDKIEVTDDKRRRLYRALHKLETEIDLDRSRLAVAVDLIAEACEGAEPILDKVQKLAAILRGAKDDEAAKLPASQDRKRIEPPKNSEEIPF